MPDAGDTHEQPEKGNSLIRDLEICRSADSPGSVRNCRHVALRRGWNHFLDRFYHLWLHRSLCQSGKDQIGAILTNDYQISPCSEHPYLVEAILSRDCHSDSGKAVPCPETGPV